MSELLGRVERSPFSVSYSIPLTTCLALRRASLIPVRITLDFALALAAELIGEKISQESST